MSKQNTARIFVHGLFGWGESDPVYRFFPQWGMGSGNVVKDLRRQGWDCHAPAVGPLSSAWDRACELYAWLTGTRTDYGAAHSARCGHARYGRAFGAPLVPDWSAERPVDLIGHSFGGATSRLLVHLLQNGSALERAACEDPSPLFLGGQAELVRSVTCIASPHNGSTLGVAVPDSICRVAEMNKLVAAGAVRLAPDGRFDFKLDQFGAAAEPDEDFVEAVRRLSAMTVEHGDGAVVDLSVDNALALNARIAMPEHVYYFSEPCCRTREKNGVHVPDTTMPPLLRESAGSMGACFDMTTPGGVAITRDWLPNDGLVNTISALCPHGAPHEFVTAETKAFRRGVWNVMPVHTADHLEIIGGFGHPVKTRRFYRALMKRLDSLE